MSAWIMSIVGVICLGVLLEILLPEGKTSKYIRGAFSLVVILVIVTPLPSIVKKDWKFQLDEDIFAIDSVYVDQMQTSYSKKLQNELQSHLKNCGYDTQITIEFEDESTNIYIVCVEFAKRNDKSIEAQKIEIRECIKNKLRIDDGKVNVFVKGESVP